MLLCKACNTRCGADRTVCPNCGRKNFAPVDETPSAPESDAPILPQAKRLEEEPGPSQAAETEVDLELDELDVLAEAVEPEAAAELKPDPPARTTKRIREPGPAVFHFSAAQVRTLVTEQPDLIEAGLTIYTEERKPVGVDFRTPVGAIDLLARDAQGGLVVVAVPDLRDVDALMPQVLARLGYVRKHVAGPDQPVRGVVVVEEIPEELAYAAAGVSDTVSFKAYRVALSFHDLEL